MAKKKIITRTVLYLKVSVLGFNMDDNPATRDFEIPMMDEKNILKFIGENVPNFTPAKLRKVVEVEQLYGMPESMFMKYAIKLPPRKNYNDKGED